VLFGDGLESFAKSFTLFFGFGEDVCEREAGLRFNQYSPCIM
jgi:hypothetical protein